MKILIFNHNRVWESSFHRGFYFARSLVNRGHEATVVTNSRKKLFYFKEYKYEGVRIVETPDLLFGQLRTGWDMVNALRRFLYVRHQEYDLSHAIDTRPTVILPALWLKKRWQVPLTIDWLDWWGRGGAITLRKNKILNGFFEPVETYFEEHFRQYADYTITISTLLKKRAFSLGLPKEKIKVIFHGCDTQSVQPIEKEKARKALNINGYENILLFSGFVLYDLRLLFNTFKHVLERSPKTLLLLTGSTNIFKDVQLKRWKGHKNIKSLGFLPKEKYACVLGAADLCILPLSDNLTNRARYPGKFGDYMASGRPVVSNDVGDVGRLIKENKVGVLTESNPKSLANGIVELLENRDLIDEMGANARRLAEQEMSFDILSHEFETVFKSLVKAPKLNGNSRNNS